MNKWNKQIIMVSGFPVKVYVSLDNKEAVLFPLFGRYIRLNSDVNVLDFATDFLLGNGVNVVSFSAYTSSLEDTAVINVETIAA